VAEVNHGVSDIAVFFTLTAHIAPWGIPTAVQIAFTFDVTGSFALTVYADSETFPAICILCAFGFRSAGGIRHTALSPYEICTGPTVTSGDDGCAGGWVSAVVVTTTHGVPFSSAFDTQCDVGELRVFFALATFSADEVEATVLVVFTLQGTREKALSFYAQPEAWTTIRVLVAFGFLARFTSSTF
jgi:hypothetical protein